ncbi:MAG TPA: hypothetical protein VJM32_04660 [Candidatus Saccharimonadales bacterium]|nr:hypothetical protein [Candidatus Saccharimonadales bacterium]
MTTSVTLRPDGFTVTGLRLPLPISLLEELRVALPVDDIVWANARHTAVFATCTDPASAWHQMQAHLDARLSGVQNYFDWTQKVVMYDFDLEVLTFHFEAGVPLHLIALPDTDSHQLHVGSHVLVLVRTRDTTGNDGWEEVAQALASAIGRAGILPGDERIVPWARQLGDTPEAGQIVALDDHMVVVRSRERLPQEINVQSLANQGVGTILAGVWNILLLPGQTGSSNDAPLGFYLGVMHAVHQLTNAGVLGQEPDFVAL